MDFDFITTCNWTETGTFQLGAYRGNWGTPITDLVTLYYRKKGTPTWSSTNNGQINITSTGEWEVANDWEKDGVDVLTHAYFNPNDWEGISAIDSCTGVYINEATLGDAIGDYFLAYGWYECKNLVSMPDGFTVPQGVKSIGHGFLDRAWWGCENLESMPSGFNLPQKATTVGSYFLYGTWYGCTSLESMPDGFQIPQGIVEIEFGDSFLAQTWQNCSKLKSMPKGFNIPQGITNATYWFLYWTWAGCSSLESMPVGFNLPQGMTSVGYGFLAHCWYNCTNLETLPSGFQIPSTIASQNGGFMEWAWASCTNLKQDGYTEDLVFEFDSSSTFGGTCPIVPDSITGASKENPVRVAVNRSAPPVRYWIGGSGNWNDTSHWSYTSGGTGGASVPTEEDDVFIDENSGFGSGGTITLGSYPNIATCRDITSVSGHSYTLTKGGGSSYLVVYGSVGFESGLSVSAPLSLYGSGTIDTNGASLVLVSIEGGAYTLLSDLTAGDMMMHQISSLDANDFNIVIAGAIHLYDNPTLIMGSGIWQCAVWYMSTNKASVIFETSTIKIVEGEESWFSGRNYVYNNLWITEGVSLFIEGDIVLNNFKVDTGVSVDMWGEIEVSSLQATGTDGNPINITGGTLSKPSGFVQCDYLVLTDSTATGGAKWYAGENSIDNGGNEGWIFRKRKYQLPARKIL